MKSHLSYHNWNLQMLLKKVIPEKNVQTQIIRARGFDIFQRNISNPPCTFLSESLTHLKMHSSSCFPSFSSHPSLPPCLPPSFSLFPSLIPPQITEICPGFTWQFWSDLPQSWLKQLCITFLTRSSAANGFIQADLWWIRSWNLSPVSWLLVLGLKGRRMRNSILLGAT